MDGEIDRTSNGKCSVKQTAKTDGDMDGEAAMDGETDGKNRRRGSRWAK